MRAYEFLTEQSHEQDAHNALITILVTNHALGISKISFPQLAKSLEERNFFVDHDWIKQAVQSIPVVDQDKTTDTDVFLLTSEPAGEQPSEPGQDLEQQTEKSVEKMAKRALAKRSR